MLLNLRFDSKKNSDKNFKSFKYYRWLIVLVTIFTVSCANIFEPASKKDTDEALYEDALKYLDASSWDSAIAKFNLLSDNYKLKTEVIENWAGAYAGKCGLIFSTYLSRLTGTNSGSTTAFKYFMNAFTGTTVDPQSCVLAENKMKEITPTVSGRSASQSFFMLLLGMVKIGAILRADADRDSTSNYGDGSMDAGFDACTVSATDYTSDGQLSDIDVTHIITGLGMVLENFAAVSASLSGGDIGTTISSISTSCSGLNPNPCNISDPANVTAAMILAMRYMIHTTTGNPTIAIGIGGCTNGVIALCCGL